MSTKGFPAVLPSFPSQEIMEAQDPFLETETSLAVVVDEYDPLKPNEYEEIKQRLRESRDKRPERDFDDRDRDRDRYCTLKCIAPK